ncbi:P-loop containing nucleoside triphosphate hydrolase protein [Lactarius hengduanensis]|nr:P-loop containing nucleoside triphosphate hydrolase protein [Lactarius hengduanensis]
MPSGTVAGAVFAIGDTIWDYPTWRERTKEVVPPFSTEASTETGLDPRKLEAVRALARRVHGIPRYGDRVKEFAKEEDNDKMGKDAWAKWFKTKYRSWQVRKDVEAVLDMHERHPRQLVGRFGSVSEGIVIYLCGQGAAMMDAQLGEAVEAIAGALFGNDAFMDPAVARPFIKAEVKSFVMTLLSYIWNQTRKSVKTQYTQLEKGKVEVQQEYEKLSHFNENYRPKAADFQPWFKKVDRLVVLAAAFGDKASEDALKEQLGNIGDMYKLLTGQIAPEVVKGLNRNLRDAVMRLASSREVDIMCQQLSERLEQEKVHMEGEVVFDFAPEPAMDWSEGVEHLQRKIPEDLYQMLGLERHAIPFFRDKICEELDTPGEPGVDRMEPFSLRWHQLVGVTRMIECAQTSQPVLLMDDVGLGKTVQVLAFFAMLAYYRTVHKESGRYPGIWGKQILLFCEFRDTQGDTYEGKKDGWIDWAGRQAALPDHPFLIVVPPPLLDQVTAECVRFLQAGSLDVVKVTGGLSQREGLWTEVAGRSKVAAGMRLYVTSASALQSDSSFVHVLHGRGKPTKTARAGACEGQSIFGRQYLALAIDEAHGFRNANKLYGAVRALREKTDILVRDDGDTGDYANCYEEKDSPVPNGRTNNEKAAIRMSWRGNCVDSSKERRTRRQQKTTLGWRPRRGSPKIREKYKGAVIRRTVNSLDYTDNAISGLEPYEEHKCVVELYEHEYQALETLSEQAIGDESFVKRFASEKFYLKIRQSLLHPSCAKIGPEVKADDPESYRRVPSAKLDSLVEILKHHLAEDGARMVFPTRHIPWSHSATSSSQQQQQQQQQRQQASTLPDKVIVYAYFTTSFNLIKMVLEANEIKMIWIDGSMPLRKRTEKLKQFKESRRDGTRVLLISNDVLWSVLDDQQLIGRIWRHPQPKTVKVYRLIGAKSPDIFLNNISFSKGFILESFANVGDKLKKALEFGDEDDITGDMAVELPDEELNTSNEKGKGKTAQKETRQKAQTKMPQKTKSAAAPPARGKGKSKQAGPRAGVEPGSEIATSNASATSSRAQKAAPQHTLAEASPSLPKSTSDKREKGLPKTIAELEELIPPFNLPTGVIDQADPDYDEQIEELKSSPNPDMFKYVKTCLLILNDHRGALTDVKHVEGLRLLEARGKALQTLLEQYGKAVTGKDVPAVQVDTEVDMAAGDCDLIPDSPLTDLASLPGTDPDTLGTTTSSVSSKRSRSQVSSSGSERSSKPTTSGHGQFQVQVTDSERGRSKNKTSGKGFTPDSSVSLKDFGKKWKGSQGKR